MPESKARYAAILDAAVDAIVLIDRLGNISDLNTATEKLFGYGREELLGQSVAILMPEPYHSVHDEYLRRYREHGQPRIIGIGREVVAKRKDGSLFPIDLAVGEIQDDEHAEGFVGFIRDLSERKAIEAQLQHREQEANMLRERLAHSGRLDTLAELATGISHEINQPLSAISTYAQACRKILASAPEELALIGQTLEKIHQQAERAGKVVQGVRRMARPHEPQHSRIDLNAMLQEIEVMLQLDVQRYGLKLQLDLDPAAGALNGDVVQLQQVVLNLVRNAVDACAHAAKGELVVVQSRAQGADWLAIQVLDRGSGIAPQLLPQIFEAFVSSKTDESAGGASKNLGLGLSISKTIVDAHHGELSCQPREGGGTCARVLLPRLSDSQ